MAVAATVYSIGHSRHPLEHFVSLLGAHDIAVVLDVRSSPVSRFSPWFNRAALTQSLAAHAIEYRFAGDALGGRPPEPELYDAEGYALYGRMAETPRFREGIALARGLIDASRVAVLCSEEDPTICHRRLLIGRVLAADGVAMLHIRGDGRVVAEAALTASGVQLPLGSDAVVWRSAMVIRAPGRPSAKPRR